MQSVLSALIDRRVRRGMLAVAVVAGSLGIWQGVAGAAPQTAAGHPASSPIEYLNANCGVSTGGTRIGTATIQRKGTVLKIKWKLKGALPNMAYDVQLWENAPTHCTEVADLGTIVTNSKGKGHGKFTYSPVGSITEVFTTGRDGNGDYNDSLNVSI